ncbi:MAG: 50S ribosomal protein L17 [Bacteroidia bacterium]|nr:50S ribosomal protein L17 [Bacteroidia bacterium]
MRHGNTINHLSRTYGHRKAMLRNMAVSLIMNKRINTTLAKAKELRKFVEPVLTRSKSDTMHNRRMIFADLQDKEAVKELFATVAEKIATRPGGYTRIIKTGFRLGDAAEMCMMELVDFNELLLADAASRKAKTTRRSRSAKKGVSAPVASVAPVAEVAAPLIVEEAPAAIVDETPAAVVEETPVVVEETPAVVEETPAVVDEAPAAEDSAPHDESPEQEEEPKA